MRRRVDDLLLEFGTDPEYFVFDDKDRPVPAHKLKFPAAKRKLTLNSDGSKAFRDGYAVEVNIGPATCRQTVTFRMQRALQSIHSMLPPGYKLVTTPAVQIDLKSMQNAPSDVRQFGCSPSLCAYTGAQKIPPIDAMSHEWRYSGAHLHFSAYWEEGEYNMETDEYALLPNPKDLQNPDTYPDIAKLMDVYLGLPLTCMFHRPELYQRRRFYGQAGEYRAQKYGSLHDGSKTEMRGFEYRTPGPELWNLPWLSSLALSIGRYVVYNRARLMKRYDKQFGLAVRNAIDTGEDRWKLLRWLPGTSYTPSLWRHLFLHRPYEATPYTLAQASSTDVTDGFYHWFTKVGKQKPKKG